MSRFYTARGQLKGVGWGIDSTSYVYHPDGKVHYQVRENDVTTSYLYDGRGMIGSVSHRNASEQSLAYREYWRDDRDRITAWKRGSGGGLNGMEDGRDGRYRYDDEGQLDLASYRVPNPEPGGTPGPSFRTDIFSYDELGNRQGSNYLASRGAVNFTRKNNGLNQYSGWTSEIKYDDDMAGWGEPGRANGVMMMEGWIRASFNALNQPMAMWSPVYNSSNFMWFRYDPLGRCVKRWVSPLIGGHAPPPSTNPATYYYYDGWNMVQEGSSGNSADRVYVHGGRVDEIAASEAGGQWVFHHYDAQGNCIMLTSVIGGIQEQYDYDAFGFPYFYTAAGGKLGGAYQWGNRFLFTGREWLKDLRIYDFRARQYHPELGRFLQPDPKHFAADDYNLYRYCHNDPINKSDPTGLDYILLWQPLTAAMQGHTATLTGNDKSGWHFFEKQGGEGVTTGNVHREFRTLEGFRTTGTGDGYSRAARVTTNAEQDEAMANYGKENYNKPYQMSGENCADLSVGIAEKGGMTPSRSPVLGSHITRPNTLAGEVARRGVDARNQVHSDAQIKKDREYEEQAKTRFRQ